MRACSKMRSKIRSHMSGFNRGTGSVSPAALRPDGHEGQPALQAGPVFTKIVHVCFTLINSFYCFRFGGQRLGVPPGFYPISVKINDWEWPKDVLLKPSKYTV